MVFPRDLTSPVCLRRVCVGIVLAILPIGNLRLSASEPASPPFARKWEAIDISGFNSSAHHWRFIRDEGRFIKALPDQPAYDPAQVPEIVENILLFQRENGGWPKDYDMTAILTDEQKEAIRATHGWADSSFDNDNIHSQVTYLAHAFVQSGEPSWRDACVRGFDYLLAAQYPNGGFPQRFPDAKDFHAHITFNDGVMIGILDVLTDAARGEPHFAWLDESRRHRARDAVQRGITCILKCQIETAGKRTGWCQQHDEITFEARPARTFELASICPQETAGIARFLMRQKSPDAAVRSAVDNAVAWLQSVALKGVRLEKVPAPKEEFERYTSDFDKIVVQDPDAPLLWARHYEISTDRPIFASRDGIKKYAFAEIERERRTGTPWYGTWPQKLIDKEYPKWCDQWDAGGPK